MSGAQDVGEASAVGPCALLQWAVGLQRSQHNMLCKPKTLHGGRNVERISKGVGAVALESTLSNFWLCAAHHATNVKCWLWADNDDFSFVLVG